MAENDSSPKGGEEMVSSKKPRRERGTGRLFRMRGSSKWYVQYYVNGRQVRESSGSDDENKAKKLLRKRIGEAAAGIHHEVRHLRYEQMRESYYADYETKARKSLRRGEDGKPRLDPVTRLDEFFAGFRAASIDPDLIRKFIADQQGKGLANGTINRSVSALRRMFNIARQDGKLRNVPYFPMLKEATARQGFFERNEHDALRGALPDYLRLPLAVGYYTGMREGEILALEWEQVNFLDGVIALRAGETKNDEARTAPIVPELRTLLVEQRAKRQPGCSYVCFRLDRKRRAVKIGSFRKAWYTACVASGLGKLEPDVEVETGEPLYKKPRGPRSKPKVKMTYRGKLFHDLRRTGVRNLVRAGVPERVAMDISGHKTRSVFDRYNIVSPNDVREAGKKLAAYHENGAKTGQMPDSEAAQKIVSPSVQ